jgi:uncharacterized membrane protein
VASAASLQIELLVFAQLRGLALDEGGDEADGVRSGFPFGWYVYTSVLQPQLLGVPVVIGFAWMALVAFASIAPANSLLPVALIGFGLCGLRLSVLTRFRSI